MLKGKHLKINMVVALVLVVGLALAACVPANLAPDVAKTSSDVTALKNDVAALNKAVDELSKGSQEPKQIERESKDQIIRGRADLLDYRMDYDAFKKAIDGRFVSIIGTPLVKGAQGKPDVPAKPGLVENQLTALRNALAGTPAQKGAAGKPDVPAKPGLLATKADVDALSKAVADLKTQLDRIEKAVAPPAAPKP